MVALSPISTSLYGQIIYMVFQTSQNSHFIQSVQVTRSRMLQNGLGSVV